MVITAVKRVAAAKKKSEPLKALPVPKDPLDPDWEDISFRDWVATEALKAFIGKFGIVSPINVGSPGDTTYLLSRAAYQYADAFLLERHKTQERSP